MSNGSTLATRSPRPAAELPPAIAIFYDDIPGNAPPDQRRGIRFLTASPGRPNPVDARTITTLETLASGLPELDKLPPRYFFFDFDGTLQIPNGVPFLFEGSELPVSATLSRFDAATSESCPGRRTRLAAVLHQLLRHGRVYVVTSNPAVGMVARMLNLLLKVEAGAGAGAGADDARFVPGETVLCNAKLQKCDVIRSILRGRGYSVHIGKRAGSLPPSTP